MADSPNKILVTGATGLVASHLVERLLAKQYTVRCLLRYPDRRKWLGDLPVEVIKGDITDPETLPPAVDGIDALIHCAALTIAPTPKDYYRFNTEGTKNLLEACLKLPNPPKFVFCSSQAAAGPSPPGRPRTAKDTPQPITDYGKSKLQAEQLLMDAGNAIETVIIRPPAVFGPRDKDIFLYFKTIANWKIKPFFGSRHHLISVVYVEDLVEALILAMSVPQNRLPNEPLFVADPKPYTWSEIASHITQTLNTKALPITIPKPIVWLTAAINELVSGKSTAFNRQKAKEMLASSWWCDPTPAMESLNWNTTTPLPEAISKTTQWYREQGWMKA
jgi:nucleoside-diphosphate-sugar epimerase